MPSIWQIEYQIIDKTEGGIVDVTTSRREAVEQAARLTHAEVVKVTSYVDDHEVIWSNDEDIGA